MAEPMPAQVMLRSITLQNAQVGVFLAYAGRHGHSLIDRRLYLPVSWTDDRDRCRAAGAGRDRVRHPAGSWPGELVPY
jgi:SRSO17 transposase